MFGNRIHLFDLFGFSIRLDPSWFVVLLLFTWSLAETWFPGEHSGLTTTTYWVMGAAGALGLFASVVLHELSHSLVARRHGLPMKGITLFLFGGVAEMSDEPPSAGAEFQVAAAGPVASVVLAAAFWGLSRLLQGVWPVPVTGVIAYLGQINALLVAFNLLPAFPLDGGRVLRSILWHLRGDLRWATRWAARVGSGFGTGFIFLGVLQMIGGALVAGMWIALIGLFLRGGAQSSYQRVLLRRMLSGEPVRRFVSEDVVTVRSDAPLDELVDDYLYRYNYEMFPVTEDGEPVGYVTLARVKEVPRDRWEETRVHEVAEPISDDLVVRPDADAMDALSKMKGGDTSRLLVVDDSGELRGILAMKDLLDFFETKVDLDVELEEEEVA